MKLFLPALLLSCLFFSACIDEVKLDIDTAQQRLAVDGLIADSLQEYTINVHYSAIIGVSTDDLKTPVTGAAVRVHDDAGGVFEFVESKPGSYTRLMQGEPGRTYHVEVQAEGKTILSRPTLLQKAPPLLPPSFKIIEEAGVSPTGRTIYTKKLSLEMNSDLSEAVERPYLRWRAFGEYEFGEDYPGIIDRKICYLQNNIDFNNIRIFDTHDLASGLLVNEPFLQMKYDYRFYFMFCYHLFQYSISEEEYRYWQNVRDIVDIDGSLFDPPPGTVSGNLYNQNDANDPILGYFSVAGVTYRRAFINATEMAVPAPPRCGGAWPPQYPTECYDCLTLPFSTSERPVYWEP